MLCGSSGEEIVFIVMTHQNWGYTVLPSDLKLNDFGQF